MRVAAFGFCIVFSGCARAATEGETDLLESDAAQDVSVERAAVDAREVDASVSGDAHVDAASTDATRFDGTVDAALEDGAADARDAWSEGAADAIADRSVDAVPDRAEDAPRIDAGLPDVAVEAGPCLGVGSVCAAASQCCGSPGVACAQVVPHTVKWCCLDLDTPCEGDDDCCGALLCKGPFGGGQKTCRAPVQR